MDKDILNQQIKDSLAKAKEDIITAEIWDSIRQEIWYSELIVLPVPENKSGVYSCLHIGVVLANGTRKNYRFLPSEVLIPELMTSEGKILPRLLNIKETPATNTPGLRFQLSQLIWKLTSLFDPDDWLIESRNYACINICTRLFWKNNRLRLELYPEDFFWHNINRYWWFDGLEIGNHQLKYIYFDSRKNRNNSRTGEVRNTPEIATNFINLHLVYPVGSEGKAVEINDIKFETVVPEKSWNIAEYEQEVKTPVQLGMSITNNTQTPFRFSFYNSLLPEIVTSDGQALERGFYRNILLVARKSHYPLAMPGETVTYFPHAELWWECSENLRLEISAGDGLYWTFQNLKLGVYYFRFVYRKGNKAATVYDQQITDTKTLEWDDGTIIATPFVELSLV
jgi:hypothetical protein